MNEEYRDPWEDHRKMNYSPSGNKSEHAVKVGADGGQLWKIFNVPEDDIHEMFVYVEEDSLHKLFNLVGSDMVGTYFYQQEPFMVGETLWHLYEEMGDKQLFRLREDGLGYYHYAGDGPLKIHELETSS